MNCDTARRRVSDRLDGQRSVAVDERGDPHLDDHLAACERCRHFSDRLDLVRTRLALAPVGHVPDVAPRIRAVLEQRRPSIDRPVTWSRRRPERSGRQSTWAHAGQVAAAFVVAFGLTAAAIGLSGPRTAQATDLVALVQAGQTALHALDATVAVTEHGWHPQVADRRHEGRLVYLAPETLGLHLEDVTAYPDDNWRPNDVTIAVDGGRSWRSGLAACPTAGLPECTPAAPRTTVAGGREPFDPADPVPLDLVLPVSSFVVPGIEHPTATSRIDGRDAVGVMVPVAQMAPLLDPLLETGNWRPIHPTDRAEVWLDTEVGVPLTVVVTAAGGFERDRWAAARGLADVDGDTLLVWELTEVRVNPDPTPPLPLLPGSASPTELGFREVDRPGVPAPGWLPEGMRPHRSGHVGDIEVASWFDGAAWLKIRATTAWDGTHLFGRDGAVVRRIHLDDAGVGYLAEGGRRLHVHAEGIDIEVAGSLPADVLTRVAASLRVQGRAVPSHWSEAATASVAEATDAMPGLLVPADPPDGFAGPAVSMTDGAVALAYSGGGARAFTVVQSDTNVLAPPVDAVVVSVEVRGVAGRYTPARGTLEWVESGRVVTVRSRTLGLAELLGVAASLEVAS